MMSEAVRYSEPWTIQVQPGFRSLIDTAAARAGAKPTEWTRKALTEALRAAGIEPAPIRANDAGALYDRLSDGRTRWALVADGTVLDLSYHASNPNELTDQAGRAWLPVRHEDSAPFDIARHWRLKPEARIDGDKVTVTFPVIDKTWETV
jgi:hypothetical protein